MAKYVLLLFLLISLNMAIVVAQITGGYNETTFSTWKYTDSHFSSGSVSISSSQKQNSSMSMNQSVTMCAVTSTDSRTTKDEIQRLLGEGKKLIRIYLSFQSENGNFLLRENGDIYQPMTWVHTTGRYGRGLLLLRYSYSVLSLGTLSFDTADLHIKVIDSPIGCLKNTSAEAFENIVRKFLMEYHKIEKTDSPEKEQICNLHVKNDNRHAMFRYYCCIAGDSGQPICSELKPDIWIQLLHVIIYILQISAFLLSPLIIPKSWYRSKSVCKEFVLNLKQPVEVRAMKDNGMYRLGQGKTIKLTKLRLFVRTHKLVAKDDVPVGILESLYNNFVRCKIRKEAEVRDCCHGNVCGYCMDGHCTFRWFKCCQMFLQIVFLFMLLIPFILWMLEFYLVEDVEYKSRLDASSIRGLFYHYEGNITTLPLDHKLYITAIAIVLLTLVTFSLMKSISKCLQSPFYEMTTSLMRNSFLNMRESRLTRVNIYKGAIISLLFPFRKFGIFALFFVILYWAIFIPVCVIIFAMYSLPVINLLIRVIGWTLAMFSRRFSDTLCGCIKQLIEKSNIADSDNKLFETNQHKLPGYIRDKTILLRLFTVVYAVVLFISLIAAFLLILDCIGFYVLVIVYVFIGIVINISQTLKYLIVAIMITLHARDCLSGISEIYLAFSQKIIQLLLDSCKEDVDKVTMASESQQEDTAFQVARIADIENENYGNEAEFSVSKDGTSKWQVMRMVLLIDKHDKPYITERFFFEACYMDYEGCPGPLLPHFTKAMIHLSTIVAFLALIIFILLAFGEETISSGNQTLITLVGGLLPFLFRSILFKSRQDSSLDVSNLNFRNGFNNMVQRFSQSFPVSSKIISSRDLFEAEPGDSEDNANEFDTPISSDTIAIKMERLDVDRNIIDT